MKKVLRTILAVILLTIGFVFYMKWFNVPLAESTANFIFQTEAQVDNCAVVTGDALDENEVVTKLEKLEEHMNTLENLIEIQNAKAIPDQFNTTDTENTITPTEKTEPTDDELFEEFKAWRENNK